MQLKVGQKGSQNGIVIDLARRYLERAKQIPDAHLTQFWSYKLP